MKGDEGVEAGEEGADGALLGHHRHRNFNLHHLAFGDVEARDTLGEQFDVLTN